MRRRQSNATGPQKIQKVQHNKSTRALLVTTGPLLSLLTCANVS